MFFPRKRDNEPFIHAVGGEYALRYLLFCGLLVLMCIAYWYHFQNRIADIQSERGFYDEHGASAPDTLIDQMRAMNTRWGVQCVVHIRKNAVLLPPLKAQTLFIGMNPNSGEGMLILPSLLRKALKSEKNLLEHDLAECLKTSPAPLCAQQTLQEIHLRLNE